MSRPEQPLEEQCVLLAETVRGLDRPIAAALLGMGEDGHFASLFPDSENLGDGLSITGADVCLPVRTGASEHPRITLTLAFLTLSVEIVLLFFGDSKRTVYEQSKQATSHYPLRNLLNQHLTPVHAIWAP